VTLGYPLGVIVGGSVTAGLISVFDWPSVFVFGGLSSTVLIPIVLMSLPESLEVLVARRPPRVLDRISRILARLDIPAAGAVPQAAPASGGQKGDLLDLFRPPVLNRTLLMSLAYLPYMTSSYFILNWATKLTTDAGFSDLQGLSISILINVGGIIGGAAIGLLSVKFPFKPLSYVTMLAMGSRSRPSDPSRTRSRSSARFRSASGLASSALPSCSMRRRRGRSRRAFAPRASVCR
jgi:hypothetical protein